MDFLVCRVSPTLVVALKVRMARVTTSGLPLQNDGKGGDSRHSYSSRNMVKVLRGILEKVLSFTDAPSNPP